MSKRTILAGKSGIVVLASLLVIFSAGCKKKAPAPPPPPPPKQELPPPPPPKPVITSFTGEPRTIQRGQSATLNWATQNATDITIDQGIGAVQSSGSRTVSPGNTTTYTLTANGPGGSDSKTVTIEVTVPPPPPPPPAPKPTRTAADILASDVQDILFDYDKSDIRADQQDTARRDGDVLKQLLNDNPGFTVVIEGHCDERGSAEYNLGLGDRRATAAKDFLVQLGVPADRLKTISYGKERPVCTEANEDCYQKNRRAHFAPGQ